MGIRRLIDNKKDRGLVSEWGFCVYIEKGNKKILLDTGASNRYLINANKLGIDISDVDYAVLSHSHIDHSGGYDSFFKVFSDLKYPLEHSYSRIIYSNSKSPLQQSISA